MKAYITCVAARVGLLGDLARRCLIGNDPLEQLQVKTLSDAGLEVVLAEQKISDTDEHIVLGDNVYLSVELLLEFIARSRQQKAMTICALREGDFTLRTAVSVQNVRTYFDGECQKCYEYNLRYVPDQRDREDGADYQVIVIDPDELHASIPMPHHVCGADKYGIPVTTKAIIQVDHWVNLWIANVVASLSLGAQLLTSSKMAQLRLAFKARSLNQWKILQQMNHIGRGCDIHPTAYIEGSRIGNGVTINAGAIVRNAIVGDGASIGNGVVIEESVIGEQAVVMHGRVLFSTLGARSFSVNDMITASYIGEGCFVGLNATMTDFRLDSQNVKVVKDGKLVDSGNRFLGSCLGHDVYVGAGCVIAPGRVIPNGLRLALAEDRIIRHCPEDGSGIEGYRLVKKAD